MNRGVNRSVRRQITRKLFPRECRACTDRRRRRPCNTAGVELGQISRTAADRTGGVRIRLIDHHGQSHHFPALRFHQLFQFGQLLSGAQNIVHQQNFFARFHFQKLAETHRLIRVLAFGPIHLVGAQGLAHAVGHGKTAGGRRDNGQLRNHRANVGIGAQLAAQPDAQDLGGLVVAHGERHLQIFVGMKAIGDIRSGPRAGRRCGAAGRRLHHEWGQDA